MTMTGSWPGHAARLLEKPAQILKTLWGQDLSQLAYPAICIRGQTRSRITCQVRATELAGQVEQRHCLVGMPGRSNPGRQQPGQALVIRGEPKQAPGNHGQQFARLERQ